jgi:Replication initiation factor
VVSDSQQNPPDTNRGVEKSVSLSIDWISVTFPKGTKCTYPDILSKNRVECRALNSYNVGAKYEDGRIELTHTTREEMGTHVICSGETLRNMPVSPESLVKFWWTAGARFKRIDIAVDAKNWNLKPETAKFLVSCGAVQTRAREFPHWADTVKKGLTQYVGKKSSEAFARVYDKASELALDEDWTRVEAVFSGERASSAAATIVQGIDLRALVRGFVDFPAWGVWLAVMEAKPVKLQADKKPSRTKEWLLKQCAPALAKELELDGSDDFWFRFIETVKEIRSGL